MSDEAGFYEEDEPAGVIRDAFERGEKGITGRRPEDQNLASGPSGAIRIASVAGVRIDPLREPAQVLLADVASVRVR